MTERVERPVALPRAKRYSRDDSSMFRRRKDKPAPKLPTSEEVHELSIAQQFVESQFDKVSNGTYKEIYEFLTKLLSLLHKTKPDDLVTTDFFDFLCSRLMVFIKGDHPVLRALCFRILRLLNQTERNLVHMLTTHVDIYTVRALDLRVENEMERVEALLLISSMTHVYQSSNLKKLIESARNKKNNKKYAFPRSVMQPVIAIALSAINKNRVNDRTTTKESTDEGDEWKLCYNQPDKLALPAISIFLEFCIYEPENVLIMAGTDWMVRVLTGQSDVSRRIASIVGRVLVAWLDDPVVRVRAQLHLVLEQIFAPLIEFGFFQKAPISIEYGEKIVSQVMENFSYSFLNILRSWSGLFACSAMGPNSTVIASSPLKLLEYLGLGTIENPNLSRIRDMVVDICCDFMDLPYTWKTFNSWDEAVAFYAAMSSPDVFNSSLKDDFVLAESEMLIHNNPEYCNHVDLLTSFRSLAFFVLLSAGLPHSLSRLIVAAPDAPSGIKATLLMADMLKAAPSLVPSAWCSTILSLPTLIQSACEALAYNQAAATTHGYYDSSAQPQYTFINAENSELVHHRFDILNKITIQNSGSKPADDSNYGLFINIPHCSESSWRRGMSYSQSLLEDSWKGDELNLKVVSLLYSSLLEDVDQASRVDRIEALDGILTKLLTMVDPLLPLPSWRTSKLPFVCARKAILFSLQLLSQCSSIENILTKYMEDMKKSLENRNNKESKVFNLKSGENSMYMFALIGAYSTHPDGIRILESIGIFQIFIEMMNDQTPVEYVKLVVACLDYSHQEMAFIILQNALTNTSEPARRWCTRFLATLASLNLPNFGIWGMRLLLAQMGDTSLKVVRHAIRILHVWLPVYPDSIRFLRNLNLETFGEAGILLQAHIFSKQDLCEDDKVAAREAIQLWLKSWCTRYFEVVDDEMRVALLSVRRSMSGSFSRSSGQRLEKYGLRTPVHLFGCLAKHDVGRRLLREAKVCQLLVCELHEENDCSIVKGALVALGHIGGAEGGYTLLPVDAVPKMVKMSEEAQVLSVRGAAFWALNILASTEQGARVLAEFGWESNRHRHVIDEAELHLERAEGAADLRRGTLTPLVPELNFDRERSRTSTPTPLRESRNRSSSENYSADNRDPAPRTQLHRSHSDIALRSPISRRFSLSDISSHSPDSGSRFERTLTGESGLTSGLGSMPEETSRRRATTNGSLGDDWETRSRSSTIAQCLINGLNDRVRSLTDQMPESIHTAHFSSRTREKWKLAPIQLRNCLQVNRNVGDPIKYFYMTTTEEQCLTEYRKTLAEDYCNHLSMHITQMPAAVMNCYNIVALPVEVEIMCMNIFSPKLRSDHLQHVGVEEDRGAKSGHGGRSQRTDADLSHSTYRCFYCSAGLEKYVFPPDVDVASLRRQVLYEVDMLEIKESTPEKKLLSLRESNRWLFEWPCLYADVLELLDEYRFKASSRAFLQEIFYDALKL